MQSLRSAVSVSRVASGAFLPAAAPVRGVASLAARAKSKGEVRMRVILRRSSPLGAAHSVISVRRGHARNVLIRNGEADYATSENLHRAALREQAEREEAVRRMQQEAEEQQKAAEANKDNNKGKEAEKAAAAADAAAAAEAEAASAAPAAPVSSSSSYLSQLLTADPAYVLNVARRLRAQPPILLNAAAAATAGGRESSDRLAVPLTLRDVYLRLAVLHPAVSLRHLSFAPTLKGSASAAPDALATFGQHEVLVRLPGHSEPVGVFFNVKKLKPTLAAAVPAAGKRQ